MFSIPPLHRIQLPLVWQEISRPPPRQCPLPPLENLPSSSSVSSTCAFPFQSNADVLVHSDASETLSQIHLNQGSMITGSYPSTILLIEPTHSTRGTFAGSNSSILASTSPRAPWPTSAPELGAATRDDANSKSGSRGVRDAVDTLQ